MPERGLNRAEVLGRVGADPTVRYTSNGKAVASFPLATNKQWKRDGETHQHTEWHRIELWEGMAETVSRYVTKGSQLYISGELKTDQYEDQNGVTRSSTKIRGNFMILLGSKDGVGSQRNKKKFNTPPVPEDDDIPF
jgi:single-strand DNA-binding protein